MPTATTYDLAACSGCCDPPPTCCGTGTPPTLYATLNIPCLGSGGSASYTLTPYYSEFGDWRWEGGDGSAGVLLYGGSCGPDGFQWQYALAWDGPHTFFGSMPYEFGCAGPVYAAPTVVGNGGNPSPCAGATGTVTVTD